jgi:hypothetical protein
MCQESLDTFESSLAELAAVTAKLERDIELNSRYKDAVSFPSRSLTVSSQLSDTNILMFID